MEPIKKIRNIRVKETLKYREKRRQVEIERITDSDGFVCTVIKTGKDWYEASSANGNELTNCIVVNGVRYGYKYVYDVHGQREDLVTLNPRVNFRTNLYYLEKLKETPFFANGIYNIEHFHEKGHPPMAPKSATSDFSYTVSATTESDSCSYEYTSETIFAKKDDKFTTINTTEYSKRGNETLTRKSDTPRIIIGLHKKIAILNEREVLTKGADSPYAQLINKIDYDVRPLKVLAIKNNVSTKDLKTASDYMNNFIIK